MTNILILPYATHARIGWLISRGRRVEALALLSIEHEDNLDMALVRLNWRMKEMGRRIGTALMPSMNKWLKIISGCNDIPYVRRH